MIQSTASSLGDASVSPAGTLRHLTQLDLSRRWRVSPRTLERWRWLGQGPIYLKVGARVIYRAIDIEAFERRQAHGDLS
jgi:hypothetical protein